MITKILGLFLIGLILVNCDARTRKTDSLKNAVEEFKKTNPSFDAIEIFPEAYSEIVTDSLVYDSFKVNIRNYSLMNNEDIIKIREHNTSKIKALRKFESKITIEYLTKPLTTVEINADTFSLRNQDAFWKNATLEHAWVDLESSSTSVLNVHFTFLNPISEVHKLYAMRVSNEGGTKVEFIEEYTL